MLADAGARRELGQSLAEGIAELLTELRRRLPGIRWLVQLDEPALPAVLAGAVPTASGLSRHRAVDRPEVGAGYTQLVDRLRATGGDGPVLVHCCAPGVPVGLLPASRVDGVLLDLDQTDTHTWDEVAEAVEGGALIGLGALPTGPNRPTGRSSRQVADRALAPLRAIGLGPDTTDRLLLTPACGLAGLSTGEAVRALRTVREAAEIVTEDVAR